MIFKETWTEFDYFEKFCICMFVAIVSLMCLIGIVAQLLGN